MELLESRTLSDNTLLDVVELQDNIRAGGVSARLIHVEIKSTKVSIFMPIFLEQPSISPYEHTKSISIRTSVCKVVQQLFLKYLVKKIEHF